MGPDDREPRVKTIVISQPMYLPWRGIFEQIARSDVFVFYDDVQLPYGGGAGRGFTTRVQIKNTTGWQWLSVPVVRESHDQLINQTRFAPGPWRRKHLAALDTSYKKAPCYDEVRGALLGPIFALETELLSDFCVRSTRLLMEYLGLAPEVHLSSELGLLVGGDASERVLAHCVHFGAARYVSGHGAKRYLRHDIFDAVGVEVCYMEYENRLYPQLHGDFLPYVSVLDLLVHTGRAARRFLTSGARYWRELPDVPERPAAAAPID